MTLESFRIHAGSGGAGRHHGGNGVIRKIRFDEPMTAAIVSNRWVKAPFGMAGGANGQPGRNGLRRAGSDRLETLSYIDEVAAKAGDVMIIETPGGGYGPDKDR
ncbi:hydantoinase B/oxoprolinase family protein [Telmatospirillum sp.]|uniref:hydantoinase B/oxoprolinase family protein n=1 Tax=Telmatospirillum sp. TaxID=2079197 RepID=UPI00386E992F